MASRDYVELMRILFTEKKIIEKIHLRLGSTTDDSTLTFTDSSVFHSTEPDVSNYVTNLQKSVDAEGNIKFTAYKDLNKYWEEVQFLVDRDQSKLNAAVAHIKAGKYKFTFDADNMLEKFLVAKTRKSNKFAPLKTEHYYIVAHHLIQCQIALAQFEKAKREKPGFEHAYNRVDNIFMRAFRNDPNFVKNYLTRQSKSSFNLEDFIKQVSSIADHIGALKEIFPVEGVPGEKGIMFVLDTYRRYVEGCIKPLNLLRIGKELKDGNQSPDQKKRAGENKLILQAELGSLLDCFDPNIRNSESHLSTEIDKSNRKVLITESRSGKRKILAEYTFQEITDMTNTIKDTLFPALLYAVYMEWRTMLLVIVYPSAEYKHMLLGIGNT